MESGKKQVEGQPDKTVIATDKSRAQLRSMGQNAVTKQAREGYLSLCNKPLVVWGLGENLISMRQAQQQTQPQRASQTL